MVKGRSQAAAQIMISLADPVLFPRQGGSRPEGYCTVSATSLASYRRFRARVPPKLLRRLPGGLPGKLGVPGGVPETVPRTVPGGARGQCWGECQGAVLGRAPFLRNGTLPAISRAIRPALPQALSAPRHSPPHSESPKQSWGIRARGPVAGQGSRNAATRNSYQNDFLSARKGGVLRMYALKHSFCHNDGLRFSEGRCFVCSQRVCVLLQSDTHLACLGCTLAPLLLLRLAHSSRCQADR